LFLLLGYFLDPGDFREWGWRLPFLASVVLVGIGLWVRLKLTETPAFRAALAHAPPHHVPLGAVLRSHAREAIAGTFAVVCCFAIFYLSTAFALGYGVATLGYDRESFLGVQLGAIGFMAIGTVIAGWWSDKTSPRLVLITGCIGTLAVGMLLPVMLRPGSLLSIWAWLSLALFQMGLVYGPLGAFLPQLFPARVRYTGVSVSFNLGGIIGGGLAPFIAQALAERGGLVPVGLYLGAAALISLIAISSLRGSGRAWQLEHDAI
jgi:MFS family permease